MKDLLSFKVVSLTTLIEYNGKPSKKDPQTLAGVIRFYLAKPAKIKDACIKFQGKCRVKYMTKSGSLASGSHSFSKLKAVLWDKSTPLPAGLTEVQWQLSLPGTLPRSFQSDYASVQYSVEAALSWSGISKTSHCTPQKIEVQRHLIPSLTLAPCVATRVVRGTIYNRCRYELEMPKMVCREQNSIDFAIRLLSVIKEGKINRVSAELIQIQTLRLSSRAETDGASKQASDKYIVTNCGEVVSYEISGERNGPGSWVHPLVGHIELSPGLIPSYESPLVDVTHHINVTLHFAQQKHQDASIPLSILISSLSDNPPSPRPSIIPQRRYWFEGSSTASNSAVTDKEGPSKHDKPMPGQGVLSEDEEANLEMIDPKQDWATWKAKPAFRRLWKLPEAPAKVADVTYESLQVPSNPEQHGLRRFRSTGELSTIVVSPQRNDSLVRPVRPPRPAGLRLDNAGVTELNPPPPRRHTRRSMSATWIDYSAASHYSTDTSVLEDSRYETGDQNPQSNFHGPLSPASKLSKEARFLQWQQSLRPVPSRETWELKSRPPTLDFEEDIEERLSDATFGLQPRHARAEPRLEPINVKRTTTLNTTTAKSDPDISDDEDLSTLSPTEPAVARRQHLFQPNIIFKTFAYMPSPDHLPHPPSFQHGKWRDTPLESQTPRTLSSLTDSRRYTRSIYASDEDVCDVDSDIEPDTTEKRDPDPFGVQEHQQSSARYTPSLLSSNTSSSGDQEKEEEYPFLAVDPKQSRSDVPVLPRLSLGAPFRLALD